MATIKTYAMPNSSILRIYSDSDIIKIDPEYQRKGDVWTLEKKQLLVDSILNEYDIPKLYFHSLSKEQKEATDKKYEYAIIDGRQRIQTIYEFIEGNFALSEAFEYLADSSVQAGNMTYTDLATQFPKLKIRFDAFTLPITLVETDDLDLIEDMFSRLNEAVPLNAAEKRNAFGGIMAKGIRDIANHDFFAKKVKFKNNRLQYYEVAAKLLFVEYSLHLTQKIIDTKKPYLDKMVELNQEPSDTIQIIFTKTESILSAMSKVFVNDDSLLKAQSPITIYYLLFRDAIHENVVHKINRQKFIEFHQALTANRTHAENDITLANYDFLEYDRLSSQGTNDSSSIRDRRRIICSYFGITSPNTSPEN